MTQQNEPKPQEFYGLWSPERRMWLRWTNGELFLGSQTVVAERLANLNQDGWEVREITEEGLPADIE